jgi:membrane-associated phospholipid phosphatase
VHNVSKRVRVLRDRTDRAKRTGVQTMKMTAAKARGADTALLQAIRPDGRRPRMVAAALSEASRQGRFWAALSGVGAVPVRTRTAARDGLVAWGAASTVSFALKQLAQRERPPFPDAMGAIPRSSSMPSSHTAGAIAYATAATLRTPAVGTAVIPVAVAVSWSRTATGRHFATDVAVGSVVGVAVGALVRSVMPARPQPADRTI